MTNLPFCPIGKPEIHGFQAAFDPTSPLLARLLVPLCADRPATDVTRAVNAIRHRQGYAGSAFQVQWGLLGTLVGGSVGTCAGAGGVDCVQITVADNGASRDRRKVQTFDQRKVRAFASEVEAIADALAAQSPADAVVCEIRQRGQTVGLFGVGPEGRYDIVHEPPKPKTAVAPAPSTVPAPAPAPTQAAPAPTQAAPAPTQAAPAHTQAAPAHTQAAPAPIQPTAGARHIPPTWLRCSYPSFAPTCTEAVLALVPTAAPASAADILAGLGGFRNREGGPATLTAVQLALRHLHDRGRVERVGRKYRRI